MCRLLRGSSDRVPTMAYLLCDLRCLRPFSQDFLSSGFWCFAQWRQNMSSRCMPSPSHIGPPSSAALLPHHCGGSDLACGEVVGLLRDGGLMCEGLGIHRKPIFWRHCAQHQNPELEKSRENGRRHRSSYRRSAMVETRWDEAICTWHKTFYCLWQEATVLATAQQYLPSM